MSENQQPEQTGKKEIRDLKQAAAFWMSVAMYQVGGKGSGEEYQGVTLDDAATLTEQLLTGASR